MVFYRAEGFQYVQLSFPGKFVCPCVFSLSSNCLHDKSTCKCNKFSIDGTVGCGVLNLKRFKSVKCRNLMKKATENIRRSSLKECQKCANSQGSREVGKLEGASARRKQENKSRFNFV